MEQQSAAQVLMRQAGYFCQSLPSRFPHLYPLKILSTKMVNFPGCHPAIPWRLGTLLQHMTRRGSWVSPHPPSVKGGSPALLQWFGFKSRAVYRGCVRLYLPDIASLPTPALISPPHHSDDVSCPLDHSALQGVSTPTKRLSQIPKTFISWKCYNSHYHVRLIVK